MQNIAASMHNICTAVADFGGQLLHQERVDVMSTNSDWRREQGGAQGKLLKHDKLKCCLILNKKPSKYKTDVVNFTNYSKWCMTDRQTETDIIDIDYCIG